MNKRLKKKLYKNLAGSNPPKWMRYRGLIFHCVISKPWGGEKAYQRQQVIRNLENFNRAMTARRIKCRKRKWIR